MSYAANSEPFEDEYWESLYIEDEDSVIDGVFNSKLHANYAKHLFKLVDYKVKTLCDIGFGLGFMLRDFSRAFQPEFVLGLEPSVYCVKRIQKQSWYKKFNLVVLNKTFQEWNSEFYTTEPFDLIILNSVIQYFPSFRLEEDIKRISKITRFVYMTLPTRNDYKVMKEELNFVDPYAHSRSGRFYRKLFSKYFSFVSYNLLESKEHVKKSPFSYELFRF